MSSVQRAHRWSMAWCDAADAAKLAGDRATRHLALARAYALELLAATLVPDGSFNQTILLESAREIAQSMRGVYG